MFNIFVYFADLQQHWLIRILTAGLWMLFLLVVQTPYLLYMTAGWLELCMTGNFIKIIGHFLKRILLGIKFNGNKKQCYWLEKHKL